MTNWRVRDAVAQDVPDIIRMIKDLAVYEKELESRVKLTEEEMLRDGFGDKPWFECVIADEINFNEGNNCLPKKKPVGYALFFYIYSTWEGRSLYLEDLYVNPAFRGKGIGTDMLRRISAIAVEKSCVRVDWSCLNWNKTAKDFYGKLGAVCLDEWQLYRLNGERLLEFAGKKHK
ncbi:diamine acetyltransferase 2-like [Orbicella faveolata]|uniref:diamine acetyltransferase 2-like n=1 Tax=Orbicella faveolata TaxID=48498 RepID=UPI0009E22FED|nr:diamine acetyltransferase 2-like [Orbicella faveolata]